MSSLFYHRYRYRNPGGEWGESGRYLEQSCLATEGPQSSGHLSSRVGHPNLPGPRRAQWDLSLLDSSMNRRIADVFFFRSRVSEDAQPENSHSNPHVAVISRQKEKEEATPFAFAPLQRTRPPAESIDRSLERRPYRTRKWAESNKNLWRSAGDPGGRIWGPPLRPPVGLRPRPTRERDARRANFALTPPSQRCSLRIYSNLESTRSRSGSEKPVEREGDRGPT